MKTKILLVEDDPNLGFIIKDTLEERGYSVVHCENGADAEEAIAKETFDLMLLDVMLPKKDGFSIAEDVRKQNIQTPIIFLTAREMLDDKVRGFKAGADDYITKPFEFEELALRIEAILSRSSRSTVVNNNGNPEIRIGIFTLKPNELKLSHADQEITITKKEAALLEFLAKHVNQPVKREDILMNIWKDDSYFAGRSMDVYITKIRKYLKPDPRIDLQNVHGVGFKLHIP